MKIGLISCVKTKINDGKEHFAKDLYCSDLFIKQLALSQKENEKTYILSAEFGLVELADKLPYYDKTLVGANKSAKESWANMVLEQMKTKGIATDNTNEFTFYAGNDYYLPLSSKLKNTKKRFNLPRVKLLQKLKEVV
jgi:hypothetical protein